VFTLSAKSTRSLRQQIARYQRFMAEHPQHSITDLCYTSNVGRAHFPRRIAGPVRDWYDLATVLDAHATGLERDAAGAGEIRKVALLFTGQGAQYPGMAAALYWRYPVFRQYFDECDRLFTLHLGRSITPIVFGETEDPAEIHQTRYTQPSLFAVEYATARLWLSWGVRPSALIGHSIGEIVAATVAGLFTLEDAVALVAARARLMHSVSAPGGMVAVRATPEQVTPLLAAYPDLGIAAVNAPQQCVVSGGRDSLAEVVATLTDRDIRSTSLAVSQAFHSPLMAEIREPFREAIKDIRYSEPELTLISTLTGKVARFTELANPDYWVRQISEPVNFAAGMRTVEQRGRHACIEVGPGAELTSLGKRCVRAADHLWLPSATRADTDGTVIRRALAQLYTAGLPVSWTGYHQGRPGRKITLPTYAFDRKRYWLPSSGTRRRRRVTPGTEQLHHPLLGREVPARDGVREFAAQLGPDQPGYLRDHVAMGQLVLPGAAYLEMLLALQDEVYGQTGRPIDDLRIHQALWLRDDQLTEVRTRLYPQPDGRATVEIVSVVTGPDGPIERCHTTATLRAQPVAVPELTDLVAGLRTQGATSAEPTRQLCAEQLYARLRNVGVAYGPAFQRVRRITRHGDVAIGEFHAEGSVTREHLPPTVLDCALQTVVALADTDEAYLAVRFGTCQLLRKPRGAELRCLVRLSPAEPDEFADAKYAADLVILDGNDPVFALRGLGYKRVTGMPVANARYDTTPGTDPARQVELAALRAQSPTDREVTLTVAVRTMIADALHFDPDDIELDAQFVELGLDSLAAVALKNSLETAWGIPLAASVTFDHPSVRLLARFLDRQLAPEAQYGCASP
jgi:acyl transferase domain-containing protein